MTRILTLVLLVCILQSCSGLFDQKNNRELQIIQELKKQNENLINVNKELNNLNSSYFKKLSNIEQEIYVISKSIIIPNDYIPDRRNSDIVLYNIPVLKSFNDGDYKLALKMLEHGKLRESYKILDFLDKRNYDSVSALKPDSQEFKDIMTAIENVRYIMGYISYELGDYVKAELIFKTNVSDFQDGKLKQENILALALTLSKNQKSSEACSLISSAGFPDKQYFGRNYDFAMEKISKIGCKVK